MRTVVCVKQGVNGELNPFDGCAYESALRIPDNEVILLSMAPQKSESFLLELTRLGAAYAVLLCDKTFAGSDTLATSYVLSCAIKKLKPDLVICGRKSLDGDTAQVGVGLSEWLNYGLIANAMTLPSVFEGTVSCEKRGVGNVSARLPAVITCERFCELRLPRLRSRITSLEMWNNEKVEADLSLCGINGSPTKVITTFENNSDKRRCKFISATELPEVLAKAREEEKSDACEATSEAKIAKVYIVGEKPLHFARTVSDDIHIIKSNDIYEIVEIIKREKPSCVLWASDDNSKELSAKAAVILKTGLCADCTKLETDGESLFMYRPAFGGNIIAKIKCVTLPQMATVRCEEDNQSDVHISIGMGATECVDAVKLFALKNNAELVATRASVDKGYMPYSSQVGLTGRTVCPSVYIALGVSGAVHHIVGMKSSKTVIAVNSDKNAPIFDYADFGIVDTVENVINSLL